MKHGPTNQPELLKVQLIALERVRQDDLTAQYNPKEVQFDKAITWNAGANNKFDLPSLEFSSTASRTLSMELMFDTYEEDKDVMTYVRKLQLMCAVMEAYEVGKEPERRPTLIQVQWGRPDAPVFEGVISSLTTKLTMFTRSGMPVRATCGVKMMEAPRTFKTTRKKRQAGPPSQW